MEWVILFIISWILFFLLIDYKMLKRNIFCGLLAISMQLFIDTFSIYHEHYAIRNRGIGFLGSSLFFILGPVLVMGTLFPQYHPNKKWQIILYILIYSAYYSFQEYLLSITDALDYINWHFHESAYINTLVMIALSWFTVVLLPGVKEDN